MSIILITIFILFSIKLLRDSLFCVWLWQVKEYRIDRMISHLKGRNRMLKNNLFYILILILFVSYFIFLKNNASLFQYLALILFTGSFLQIIREIKNRSLKRPKSTFKVILILLSMLIVYASAFLYSIIIGYVITFDSNISTAEFFTIYSLFVYLFAPIVITLVVLFINPFFNFQKRKIIKRASEKMEQLKKIKVIGITGSYGKTSTKEFLYTILSEKYKVVKTEGNNNTNIGVAYTILNKVNDEYDYFICEMGAYKIGEIKEICGIANPEIGILTGINEQHIELFGSIENTRTAKFELIEFLPDDGFAIINKKIKNYKPETKVQSIKYFSKELATDIEYKKDHIEFRYKNQLFKTNILGQHYIENIISAIMVAEHLEMNLSEIARAVEKIKPTEYIMRKLNGPNGSVLIDDSYSANPDGVMAALDYLEEAYEDYRKIIVFSGIIELGDKSKRVHQKLFNRIDTVCDEAYILNDDLKNTILIFLERGIEEEEMVEESNGPKNKNCEFVFENDFDKVTEMVEKDLKFYFEKREKIVVLFESRGAGVVMRKLKNN
ncbi:MAG: UDP-N-acetylmuramoyl-tripeptide--D-alanyl-D-alanine ligase [Candidatus Pacebacteria bacterium]|nr:UDP-N-acetylmuramoyl-tripeptide--D-alanyl-D-alanine ligase [Candidatus Paceibacterota bacterium]